MIRSYANWVQTSPHWRYGISSSCVVKARCDKFFLVWHIKTKRQLKALYICTNRHIDWWVQPQLQRSGCLHSPLWESESILPSPSSHPWFLGRIWSPCRPTSALAPACLPPWWRWTARSTSTSHVKNVTLKINLLLLLAFTPVNSLWRGGHQVWSRRTLLPAWRRARCSWRCSGFSPPPCLHPGWWRPSVWWRCPPVLWQNQHLHQKMQKTQLMHCATS